MDTRALLDELTRLGLFKTRDENHPDGPDYFLTDLGVHVRDRLQHVEKSGVTLVELWLRRSNDVPA